MAPRSDTKADRVAERRSAARIDLLETDCHFADEVEAFDVVVNGVVCGYWARTAAGGSIEWTRGQSTDTGDCGGDRRQIVAAIRRTIPAVHVGGGNGN